MLSVWGNSVMCSICQVRELKLSPSDLLSICVTYRPPSSCIYFFDKFSDMMEKAILEDGEIVVLGDFNCDVMKYNEDSNTRILQSTMDGFLFSQLINVPTRVTVSTQTLIDHIYTTNPEKHILSGVFNTAVSDHYLIFTVYGEDKPTTASKKIIQWRDFKGEVQSRITIISKERVQIYLQIGAKIMKIG